MIFLIIDDKTAITITPKYTYSPYCFPNAQAKLPIVPIISNNIPNTLSKNSLAYLGDGKYIQIDMTKKDGFFEPFAFDTKGDHGKGFTIKSYTSPENRMSDFSTPGGNFTSKRSYNYIEDANTKNQVRGYIRNIFGQQLPNGVIDQIANNLIYYQDWNAFQSNRWMVTLPGTDSDGSVKNPTQVQKFFSNATSIIRGWESTKNKSTLNN